MNLPFGLGNISSISTIIDKLSQPSAAHMFLDENNLVLIINIQIAQIPDSKNVILFAVGITCLIKMM